MARYRVPDHLICLGQGGIEVGETFMKQDWIIEEVLRDDPRDDATDKDQNPLHAFFIDSDKSTLPTGVEDTVSQRVDRITDEYDIIRPPDVDVTTINVAEGTHEQYLTSDEVTSDATIRDMATDLGLEAWWLQAENNDILGPLDGLKRGGVDRRRGLTKAISRICEWQSDPLHEVERSVEGQNEAHVAIVVGLGGGTGSGLFLDLARRIKRAGATVTLFGVLPAPTGQDGNNVLANAYATLSELEYLALSSENYFRNILLLPYDAAMDDDVFDKAATYTITSYYNLSDQQTNTYENFDETDQMDGPPKYAPFTLASSRYLHYLKEDIEQTEENFKTYSDNKKDALSAEEELYDELRSYLTDNHSDAAEELYTTGGSASTRLPSGDATDLRTRLRETKALLDQDIMAEMEFRSPERVLDEFEEVETSAEDKANWEDEQDKKAAVAREFVTLLSDSIDNVDDYEPRDGEWAANERDFVRDVIIREFELVARRAGLIKAKEALKSDGEVNDDIATDIDLALSLENYGHVGEVDDKIEEFEGKISDLKDEISALETLIDDGSSKVDEFEEDWKSAVEGPVEDFYDLYDRKSEIESLLTELKDAIDDEISLENANEPDNIYISGTEFDSYPKLNDLLAKEGCDEVNESHIEETVKNVKKAKKKRLEAEQLSGSFTETVLSVLGQGRIGGLQSNYGTLMGDIDSSLVRMPEWTDDWDTTIQSSYFDERKQSLENRETNLLDDIRRATSVVLDDAKAARGDAQEFLSGTDPDAKSILENFDFDAVDADVSRVLDHLDPEEHDTLENARSADGLLGILRDGPVEDLLSTVLVNPFEDRKAALEDELASLQSDLDTYETLNDIVTQKGAAYTRADDNVDSVKAIATFEEGGDDGPFKKDAEPRSRGNLGNSSHLGETTLWAEDDEREKLLNNMDEIVPDLGGEHLPIDEIHISDNETEQTTYNGFRLGTAFMSPLFEGHSDDDTADIPSITNELLDNRVMDKNEMLIGRGSFGDSYDVVMTTFLTGVFLDNLSVFIDECREAYTSNTDVVPSDSRHNHQDTVPSIVKSHNYGLDGVTYHDDLQFFPPSSDGGFCYRRDVLNFDTDGTEVLLDQGVEQSENEDGVVDALLRDYHEVVGYESTVDIN